MKYYIFQFRLGILCLANIANIANIFVCLANIANIFPNKRLTEN